jgi:abortive infection alpha-like protein
VTAGAPVDGAGPESRPRSQELAAAEALPELARAAADAWVKTAWWSLAVSLKVGTKLARVALDPGAAVELAQEFSTGVRGYAREFLGIADLEGQVRQIAPPPGTFSRRGRRNGGEPSSAEEDFSISLREQGAALLRAAADVAADDELHPAYARILGELAPDEARILRLLATEGPQPQVDVRAANLIGVGSQLVAHGLNMLGPEAGARHHERVGAYLDNLVRLGLVRTGAEPLTDPTAYQVLEAQPEVLEAIKRTTRAKSDRHSIRLTPFGAGFCHAALPLDGVEPVAVTQI